MFWWLAPHWRVASAARIHLTFPRVLACFGSPPPSESGSAAREGLLF